MASLTISSAAERTLVSGSSRVTAAGESRPTGRRIDLRTAVLAFVIVGLGVAGTLPSAVYAKALASASLNIVDFSWYRVGGGPLGEDIVLTSLVLGGPPGPQQDTVLRGGSDEVALMGALNGVAVPAPSPPTTRSHLATGGLGPLEVGPACSNGTGPGCTANLNPIGTLGSQAVSGYSELDGYYAAVPGDKAGLSGGLRSDVSLLSGSTTGTANGEWTSVTSLRPNVTVDTYFRVEFAAQALARPDDVSDMAEARVLLEVSLSGSGITFGSQEILNLQTTDGDLQDNRTVFIYANTGNDPFTLVAGANNDYTLSVTATTMASAGTGPSNVPVPPAWSLVLAGLVPLVWRRRRTPATRLPL
ncbi:hypothetical protein [Thiohalocapsa sp. ML1]|jgi:hypothetical protein|uniref:hypothetical protein n=1 Tax=Thiohalocapsa sp. ML1 TaxID=1431688 RepID=UPI0012E3742D|nr:hypothetical protein [Thiohalocapsa sp. ML1]